MAAVNYITDLAAWWRWELSALSGWIARPQRRRPAAVLRLARDGVRIQRPGPGGTVLATVADPGQAGARLREIFGRRCAVDLLIAPDRHLQRTLSPLRLPKSRMVAMARLDLSLATPFRDEDYFLLLPEYRRDDATSVYHLVMRSHVAPLLAGLQRAGIRILQVSLAGDGDPAVLDRRSAATMVLPRLGARLSGGLRGLLTATALVGALAAVGLLHWRQIDAARHLDGKIATAEAQAAELRHAADDRNRRLARIAAVRSAKSEAVPFVRALEELARTLPDTTWLTEIEFDEKTMTFSGVSQAASALIPSLEASPLFRAPIFSQPVLRDVPHGGERFTITLQTETEAADG